MIKKILPILLFFGIATFVMAQQKEDLFPCGTSPLSQQQLKAESIQWRGGGFDTTLYVPLSIHNLANEGTSTFFSIGKILDAFDRLNKDYSNAGIHFFMEGDIVNKRNTAWNTHKTVVEGADMMFANNVKNTLNIYVCTNAAGNCGYNLPYAGIALAKSCMGANDHTWAHEIGHALSLPHPFLGWEAKTWNPNQPTPTRVTYDYTHFKDTVVTGKTIIDTAYVELVDGSNCSIAADQICDTKPDYISTRWTCDANGKSPITYKDPNGVSFKVDGSLIMSYSNDACQNRFSDLEIAKMRGTLYGKRNNWLYNQVPKPEVSDIASIITLPAINTTVSPIAVSLKWDGVSNAERYVLQISRVASFSFLEEEVVVNTTQTMLDLEENRTYYTRVRAYNSHDSGTPWSSVVTFKTGAISAVHNSIHGVNSFVAFPNPLEISSGDLLNLKINTTQTINGDIEIYNLTGSKIYQQSVNLSEGTHIVSLNTVLPKGCIMVAFKSDAGRVVQKVLVVN